jgi:dihydroorotase
MKTQISGARIPGHSKAEPATENVLIVDGVIAEIGDDSAGWEVDESINASGLLLLPGLVDLCARLGEPGFPQKGTIASESLAAAAGGFTTLCCPPDSRPILDSTAAIKDLQTRVQQTSPIHIHALGAMTEALQGQALSDMAALKHMGCLGVSNARKPLPDALVVRCAMQYAASLNLTVFLNPEDPALAANGCAHEGRVASRLGLPGIPAAAECAALARDLVLIEDTGVRAHFCRLSSRRAAEMIEQAQAMGLAVTADVAIHQLFLTDMDLSQFDALCHTSPPLRDQDDRDYLRDAVKRGTIMAICSDHCPHERDAKLAPFAATEPGISGLDTTLSLALRLVDEGVIELADLGLRLASGPAAILGLPGSKVEIGAAADLCLVDPEKIWRVSAESLRSQGKNTPFAAWELRGQVQRTLVAGETVYQQQDQ